MNRTLSVFNSLSFLTPVRVSVNEHNLQVFQQDPISMHRDYCEYNLTFSRNSAELTISLESNLPLKTLCLAPLSNSAASVKILISLSYCLLQGNL